MDNDAQTDGGALLYQQDDRLLILDSPLGRDNVILTELHGEDAISSPFRYKITFATLLDSAKVKNLLGQKVTVLFGSTPSQDRRPLNALVRHLSGPAPGPRGFRIWQAELVPQLAFLGFTQDCRIFQKLSVLDILRSVFKAHGLDQFEFRGLMGHYQPLEYCVQYRETALNFVSRLMEHSGLFYWHEFTSSSHTLVITDSNLPAKSALDGHAKLPSDSGFPDIDSLTGDYAFRSGKWTLTDYDFTSPTKSLLSHTPTMYSEPAMTQYELYDFPGQYYDPQDGDTLTRLRMEHEEMRFHMLHGTGRRAVFSPGYTVELDTADAQALDIKGKLLFTAVWHEAVDYSFVTQDAEPAYYRNRFEAIPAERPYRPACATPKPVVQGVQCAVVVGPPGEYIYTDEHGRVKVRFFWDRNPFGNPDENRSCWLRVSQAWADGKFGGVHLPRIGQEVLVDFLEGDPDRPLVTGRVYNGDNAHPYELPGNKNQSGFKSQSVPSNGGWNEFRFDDTGGSEEIYLRAQHDHNHWVGHDHDHTVGNDYNITINNNYTVNTTSTESSTSAESNKTTGVSNEVIGVKNEAVGVASEAIGMQFEVVGTEVVAILGKAEAILAQAAAIGFSAEAIGMNVAYKYLDNEYGVTKGTVYSFGTNSYITYVNDYILKKDNAGVKVDIAEVTIKNSPIEIKTSEIGTDACATKLEQVEAKFGTITARLTSIELDMLT
jgi:type VI secretion system secreted protein VgrG